MIRDIIWLMPILCLSGSILYCLTRLWMMYWKSVHIWVNHLLEKMGLWKTGIGRWTRLGRYISYYTISAILSVLIYLIASIIFKVEITEQFTIFMEHFSIIEAGKFFATIIFAIETMFISLMMYGRDFTKMKREHFNPFFRILGEAIFAVLIWLVSGIGTYKDWFFRATQGWSYWLQEWFSSPGRVVQLCWGIVSVIIFGSAVLNIFRDMQRDWNSQVE